jgi:hypothetical protein
MLFDVVWIERLQMTNSELLVFPTPEVSFSQQSDVLVISTTTDFVLSEILLL